MGIGVHEPPPLLLRLKGLFGPAHRPFWLIVANGVIFQGSQAMIDGRRVGAAFLMELTGRDWIVGLVIGLNMAMMGLPQLYTAYVLSDGRPRMAMYVSGAHLRWGSLGLLVVAVLTLRGHPMLLAGLVVALLGLCSAATGLGLPAFGDVVSRTVEPHRRGRLFGLRLLFGGFLALLMGGVVNRVLAPDSVLPFPYNYALLFSFGLFFLVTAQLCFMRIDEPPTRPRERPANSFPAYLRHVARQLVREPDARHFALFAAVSTLAWAPLALLVPYAMGGFGLDASVTGWFVATGVLAGAATNPFWMWVSDRRGNRLVLRLVSAGALTAVALASLTPAVAAAYDRLFGLPAPLFWLLLVNGVAEAAMTGGMIGGNNYVYELAPEGEVPRYVAAINSSVAPISAIAYPLCGWIAQRFGYPVVFGFAGLFATARLVTALLLAEPRRAAERDTGPQEV